MEERRPWILDEHNYPLLLDGQIVYRKRREFTRSVIDSKANGFLRYNNHTRWLCFWSGVQCHWGPPSAYDSPPHVYPWMLNIDHLCPQRAWNCFTLRDQGLSDYLANALVNQAISGRALNRKLGHSPLPVKLHIRQHLETLEFDRTAGTSETFDYLLGEIIKLENRHSMGGKYPWQPWSYSEGDSHRAAAQAVFEEMLEVERQFLTTTTLSTRDQFIEKFQWKW